MPFLLSLRSISPRLLDLEGKASRRVEEGRLLPRLVLFGEVGVDGLYCSCEDGECSDGDGGLSMGMLTTGS